MTRVPISTYRLQLTAEFDLNRAAALVGYLHDLGADWVYLSPLLQAVPGSRHGYDVVDHARVDVERGGAEGLDALSRRAHDAGLGVLADIVPNHMGVARAELNAWWWDVLREGRASRYADWFDIDWDAGAGRVLIPVLGGSPDEAVADGSLRIEEGELRYADRRFPLAVGTGEGDVLAVLARQHYDLVHWRSALNYRRFFGVSDLAAIRVELPEVFAASHREIVRWVEQGLVDGLRVDHPDGLADPGGYLEALAAATGSTYVLVEKILEPGELLPPHWATAGTTGYDALATFDRVLVDPRGRARLDALDASLRAGSDPIAWPELIHRTKRAVADGLLNPEVRRLVRELPEGLGDPERLADAMAELLACFPVYRSYLPFGVEHLERASVLATLRRADLADEIEAIAEVLVDPEQPAAIRFQQTSGMVMAKGVEDTAFYRVSRLASLTEVGADPDEFALPVEAFHARQQTRLATQPASMTTLSTHDTKRGEDTRARISVLAEIPDEWAEFIDRRRSRHALGDGGFENLLWESIVGAWPREREALHAYAEKAAREAGRSTSWTDPDEGFEARMHELVDAAFDDEEVNADLEAMVARLRGPGWSNGLAAKVLQLTGPGVPDVYQGSELWEHSLVDPDNRRPVDFEQRRALLERLDAGERPEVDAGGAVKLLVTSRALRARRDRPELFTRYTPLPVLGRRAAHLIAVDRGGAIALATRLPVGLAAAGGWGETTVLLPAGPLVDEFTGERFAGGETPVAELLHRYPVALLLADGVRP